MEHCTSCLEMLDFALRLVKTEPGKMDWIPSWVIEMTGCDAAVLGIRQGKNCLLFYALNSSPRETGSLQISPENAECLLEKEQQGSPPPMAGDLPCFQCPALQKITKQVKQKADKMTFLPFFEEGCFLVIGKDTFAKQNPDKKVLPQTILRLITGVIKSGKERGLYQAGTLPPEDVDQMWSELVAGLSHDMRTPLSSIKGYATTLLRKDVTWDAATQEEFLKVIVEEADYLESLITKLLDSTTLSWKGEMELRKEPVSLPQLVTKVLSDPAYHRKQHTYATLFPPDYPRVEADPVLIERVLRNLVENAVKYSPENTLIVIKGEFSSSQVVVSVADQGIGIEEDHLNRLFEKFYRVTRGPTKEPKGIGLGLPLARQIVTSHGGRIWAKSKPMEGAVFYFSLPL